MKKFQKSVAVLDSIIAKLQKNYGVSIIPNIEIDSIPVIQHDSKLISEPKIDVGIIESNQIQSENQPIKPLQETTLVADATPIIQKQKKTEKKTQENSKIKTEKNPLSEIIELFKKAELRVGEIEHAEIVPDSEKLYMSKVNMGDHHRSILSGIRKHVPLSDMSGKVIVFCNLKPRQLAGHLSEGMLLCAENQSETIVELLRPKQNAKVGDLVTLGGVEDYGILDYKAPNSKIVDAFLKNLITDKDKKARFGEYLLVAGEEELQTTSIDCGKIK